jgi:D-glycero-D-manno-heptose 1,7-bisphosphate phosphatase
MNKAAFLDRDGVINPNAPDGGYTTCWEDFHFLPGVAEAIALLNRANYLVIVATNQRGIAKGLLTIETLEEIHTKMASHLSAAGACIDAIYYCPHGSDEPCACRKPSPGMLLSAAQQFDIDLANSWMIGDSNSDMEAGKSAGCRTIKIVESPQSHQTAAVSPDLLAESLLDATRKILGQPHL